MRALGQAVMIGLAVGIAAPAAAGELERRAAAGVPAAQAVAGRLAAALPRAQAGSLPSRARPVLSPALIFGAAIGLLNTGKPGQTIPPPFTGGD